MYIKLLKCNSSAVQLSNYTMYKKFDAYHRKSKVINNENQLKQDRHNQAKTWKIIKEIQKKRKNDTIST